jgi:hypothetical protein
MPIYYSMKNTGALSVFVFTAVLSYAQNGSETRQVTTQSNGVVVHESAGNEGFTLPQTSETVVKVRTVEDWTLPECIDALQYIADKISTLGSSEEDMRARQLYTEQQLIVEKRRDALMGNQH